MTTTAIYPKPKRTKLRHLTHGTRDLDGGGVTLSQHVTVGSSDVADDAILNFNTPAATFTVYLSLRDLRWLAAQCTADADAIEKDIAEAKEQA